MAAAFFSFIYGQLLRLVTQARDRAVQALEANKDAWPGHAIVALVLAGAAAEAFINEFAEWMAVQKAVGGKQGKSLPPALVGFADALAEIEASRGTTTLKYLVASLTLGGKAFDKGAQPYQDFATLMTIRNDIMHLKPREVFVEENGAAGRHIRDRWPKYITALQGRGLARPVTKGGNGIWLNLLKTDKVACWACQAALAIIRATLDLFPDTNDDPSRPLKSSVKHNSASLG
jgi:hypothetical protein